MKPNTLKIDDVEYIRADSVDSSKKYDGPIKIIVADRHGQRPYMQPFGERVVAGRLGQDA